MKKKFFLCYALSYEADKLFIYSAMSFLILLLVFSNLTARGGYYFDKQSIFSVTQPIQDSDLSTPAKKALEAAGIKHFRDVINKRESELLRLLNFDGRIFSEILDWLINIGQLGTLGQLTEGDSQETILDRDIESFNFSDHTTRILKNSRMSYLYKMGIKTKEEILEALMEGAMKTLENRKQIQNLKIFFEVKTVLKSRRIKMSLPSDWELELKLSRKLDSRIKELLPIIPPILAQPIEDLELSTRIKRALVVETFGAFTVRYRQITYLGELVFWPEEELRKFQNIGKKSLAEIRAILASKGLKLGMNINWPIGQNF